MGLLVQIPEMEPLYSLYITKHPTALEHLHTLPQTPALTAYLSQCRTLAQSLTHAWDLPSLLIKPVQRLLKYSLLLRAIIDETPDSHGDKKALKEAKVKMEAVAHGVNEGRRRREVVKEVLTGTPSKKGESKAKKKGLNMGVAASVNLGRMKSIRAASFKAKEGVDANQEAEQVIKMGDELKACERFINRFAKDTVNWAATVTEMMRLLQQWTIGFGTVIGLSDDQQSDAFDAFLAVIRDKLVPICEELTELINTKLLIELRKLRDTTTPPERLLEAMKTLEPYHYGLLNVNVSKSRPSPQLLEASQSYVAIRAQLFAELPKYLELLHAGVTSCIVYFAGLQAEYFSEVRERWSELWDALKVEGEFKGEAAETLRVWWSRFAEVEAHVNALHIIKPMEKTHLRDVPPEKLKVKPAKGRKRSLSNSIDTFSGLSLNSPDTPSLRASTSTQSDYFFLPEYAELASPPHGRTTHDPLDRRQSNDSLHSKKSNGKTNGVPHRHTHSNASDFPPPEVFYARHNTVTQATSPRGKEISHPLPLKKSASQSRLLEENNSASSSMRSLHDGGEEDERGRPSRKPSLRRRLTDSLRPSPGPPPSGTRHRRSPSLPAPTNHVQPSPTPSQLSFAPRPRQRVAGLYQCQVIFNCTPPPDVSYHDLPFFTLRVGEVYDVLQEQGHPSTHPDLPLYVDDGEDCLLLVRDAVDDIGWALASFLLPVA